MIEEGIKRILIFDETSELLSDEKVEGIFLKGERLFNVKEMQELFGSSYALLKSLERINQRHQNDEMTKYLLRHRNMLRKFMPNLPDEKREI